MLKLVTIIAFLKKHWYLPVFVALLVAYLLKKKKAKPISKDENANTELARNGIKDATSQNRFKAYASQIAQALGTAYPVYDPRRWVEDDAKVFELVKELDLSAFKIVKELYFSSYAKGRDLTTDLANMLDDKYYKLLKVK